MSYPILYDSTESDFNHNGKGILSDCISCQVTEEANGKFEMTIKYPSDGIHFDKIEGRSLLKVKVDQYREPQLFRVYEIKKDMSKNATIYAEHISYDLSGIPVSPYTAPNVYSALMMLKYNSVTPCPFEFWTDKNTDGSFKVTAPASIRSRLGGVQGSILDVYGGEYEFDNFTVKLHNQRGKNRGFSIRYGKNLIDFDQEKNCSSVATGIYPYWADAESGKVVQLDEKIINADGNYNFVRIKTVDFSADFETEPTQQQLREKAQKYVKNNEIGIPKVSLKISFAQLSQSEEYKGIELAERISLFDTVNVEFPEMGVSANARVNKIVYDIVKDKIKSATLGSIRANIADTLVSQNKEIEDIKIEFKSDLQKAKEAATEWLTNGKGYAYFRKDSAGNIIDILFMDTQNPETAVNVMRIGQSGIGFSNNGVDGEYTSAWTLDGRFVADFITTGTLYGLRVKAGMIESEDGSLKIDLSSNKVIIDVSATGDATTGKVEISREGIIGYGYDYDKGDYVESLIVMPGYKHSANGGSATTINSFNSPYGMVISTGVGEEQILDFAPVGKLKIQRKTVSWKDNGDGTYTLIGQ